MWFSVQSNKMDQMVIGIKVRTDLLSGILLFRNTILKFWISAKYPPFFLVFCSQFYMPILCHITAAANAAGLGSCCRPDLLVAYQQKNSAQQSLHLSLDVAMITALKTKHECFFFFLIDVSADPVSSRKRFQEKLSDTKTKF